MRVKRNGRDWERNCWDYSKGCRAMASLIRRNFEEFKSFALDAKRGDSKVWIDANGDIYLRSILFKME